METLHSRFRVREETFDAPSLEFDVHSHAHAHTHTQQGTNPTSPTGKGYSGDVIC